MHYQNMCVDDVVCRPKAGVRKKDDLSEPYLCKFDSNSQVYFTSDGVGFVNIEAVGVHKSCYRDIENNSSTYLIEINGPASLI